MPRDLVDASGFQLEAFSFAELRALLHSLTFGGDPGKGTGPLATCSLSQAAATRKSARHKVVSHDGPVTPTDRATPSA